MGTNPSKHKKLDQVDSGICDSGYLDGGRRGSDLDARGNSQAQDKMSFFRKQSSDAKRRQQHKIHVAKHSPESTFDIADCEISDVPSGVFSLCKVLQKEALLLQNNWLSSLKGGGQTKDLVSLRVLDLHDNELSELPADIGELKSLQVLNLENNRLKHLPDGLGTLSLLQTLNLKGNKLKEIPTSLCNLNSLRTLDLRQNHLTRLPAQLCQVRTLENLLVDTDMEYPPADICYQGTEAMMRFLCSECGVDYVAPSKVLLEVLEVPKPLPASQSNHSLKAEMIAIADTVMHYENIKEKKRQEMILLERQLEEDQRLQAELVNKASSDKRHLVDFLAEHHERMNNELSALQQKKEFERQDLVNRMYEVERSAEALVNQMLEMNEKARKTEELMEAMERERIEAEQLFVVRAEEAENLRRLDVLKAMEQILEETTSFEAMRQNYERSKDEAARRAQTEAFEAQGRLGDVLMTKQTEQNILIEQLMKEEAFQKEAFEALQLQKDAKHKRIMGQIALIEEELFQLTLLEVEQRDMRFDTQKNVLAERRQALTTLLIQLLQEKDKREDELKHRLSEMEQQRLDDQTDYWLVQYQRLMDRKPQSLIDQERQLEFSVIQILEGAGATEYISLFARHRISIETLCQMNDADLKQIGVHEFGVRKTILNAVEEYMASEKKAAKKTAELEAPTKKFQEEEPAPGGATAVEPSAPPAEVRARISSECVVCMNAESDVVFLNCGHVCCCYQCSQPLQICPLCRGQIVQRVRLARGT